MNYRTDGPIGLPGIGQGRSGRSSRSGGPGGPDSHAANTSLASRLMDRRCAMSLSHHSLVAWERADDLFINLHRLSLKAFPAIERFALGSRLRRAAFSVAVNIVEGFARPAGRGRLNCLNISQSSLAEVGYCIHAAKRLGYLTNAEADKWEVAIKQVGAPLAGLIRSEKKNAAIEVGPTMISDTHPTHLTRLACLTCQ